MSGRVILHILCACARRATLPNRSEWDALTRDQMLRQLRCRQCGRRPVDLRRGWDVDAEPYRHKNI